MALCEKKSLTGRSLKIGTTQSRGVMNATFKSQWPRMHLPRDRGLRLFFQIAESFQDEFTMDNATKEAMAINNILLSCSDEVRT